MKDTDEGVLKGHPLLMLKLQTSLNVNTDKEQRNVQQGTKDNSQRDCVEIASINGNDIHRWFKSLFSKTIRIIQNIY